MFETSTGSSHGPPIGINDLNTGSQSDNVGWSRSGRNIVNNGSVAVIMGVATAPGMALALMPSSATSLANVLASATTPAMVAAQSPRWGPNRRAAAEAVKMIDPPLPAFPHRGHGDGQCVEHAREVGVDDVLPLLGRDLP